MERNRLCCLIQTIRKKKLLTKQYMLKNINHQE